MTDARIEDKKEFPFASEAEELAYLRQRVSALESYKSSLEKEKISLMPQLDYWKKRFFGRMSEKRHLPLDPNQQSLFSAEDLEQMSPEEKTQLEAEVQKQEGTIT